MTDSSENGRTEIKWTYLVLKAVETDHVLELKLRNGICKLLEKFCSGFDKKELITGCGFKSCTVHKRTFARMTSEKYLKYTQVPKISALASNSCYSRNQTRGPVFLRNSLAYENIGNLFLSSVLHEFECAMQHR